MKVTAIFDIGKTNKKLFLFDENLTEVYHQYISLPEVYDEDGVACDDLSAVEAWMLAVYRDVLSDKRFELTAINVSGYGATLVHLDSLYKPVTPLYSYSKVFPSYLIELFRQKYGDLKDWSQATASPLLGMLNAGLQLFWLKHEKQALFSKIKYTLFLPQYLSFLFSKKMVSEYTGIGCHTGMWHFAQNDFHDWMYEEGFVSLLAPLEKKIFFTRMPGTLIRVGMGIHDSSAALLPYITKHTEPFLLLSTGTWCICLNPFDDAMLSDNQLANDCLCFLQPDGSSVKASRLFLGHEYNLWVKKLSAHFGVDDYYHKKVVFSKTLLDKAASLTHSLFNWESISGTADSNTKRAGTDLNLFCSFEEAYHHLLKELIDLQIEKIRLVLNGADIRKIFLDGGFVDNEVFVNILKNKLPGFEIIPSSLPLGSAMGAALMMQITDSTEIAVN